jgi:hypothetical protein
MLTGATVLISTLAFSQISYATDDLLRTSFDQECGQLNQLFFTVILHASSSAAGEGADQNTITMERFCEGFIVARFYVSSKCIRSI